MGYSRLRRNRHGHARYTAYYWDLRGRARSAGTFNRKRDADRAWRRAEAGITEGRFLDLTSGRQRFDRYVTEAWLPGHVMETNTRQGYKYTLRKYLLPQFAPIRMNEIAPNHIRGFLAHLGTDGASAHTLTRCRSVLSAIFTTALNDQVIYFHPCTGVTTLGITTPEQHMAVRGLLRPAIRAACRGHQGGVRADRQNLRKYSPSPASITAGQRAVKRICPATDD